MTKVGHIDDRKRGLGAYQGVPKIESLVYIQAGQSIWHSLLVPQQLLSPKYMPDDPHLGKAVQRLEYQPVGLLRFQEKPSS